MDKNKRRAGFVMILNAVAVLFIAGSAIVIAGIGYEIVPILIYGLLELVVGIKLRSQDVSRFTLVSAMVLNVISLALVMMLGLPSALLSLLALTFLIISKRSSV